MKEALLFLREFIKHPISTGAIYPSSQELAQEIVTQGRVEEAEIIAEFGAGTGVFTKEIIRRKKSAAKFLSIEYRQELVDIIRREIPEVDIACDSVENLITLMKERNLDHLDSIVCGLPWAAFSEEMQDKFLAPAVKSLKEGGRFVTFAYLQGLLLPAGHRFQKKIASTFSEVHRSRIVWKNLPPAFVYVCTK
ncbi:methyltransferase domain-containing protein [bacterium]|nr:methyltransferase domain-containing protein [bacterium]